MEPVVKITWAGSDSRTSSDAGARSAPAASRWNETAPSTLLGRGELDQVLHRGALPLHLQPSSRKSAAGVFPRKAKPFGRIWPRHRSTSAGRKRKSSGAWMTPILKQAYSRKDVLSQERQRRRQEVTLAEAHSQQPGRHAGVVVLEISPTDRLSPVVVDERVAPGLTPAHLAITPCSRWRSLNSCSY